MHNHEHFIHPMNIKYKSRIQKPIKTPISAISKPKSRQQHTHIFPNNIQTNKRNIKPKNAWDSNSHEAKMKKNKYKSIFSCKKQEDNKRKEEEKKT